MSILDVNGILVSTEVIDTYFCCDLEACHGACCIEGESGAPVRLEEEPLIQKAYPLVRHYIPESQQRYIQRHGLTYTDADGEAVTMIVDGRECVFTCFEKDGSARCAFEKGCTEGTSRDFYKPLSCHLFPIRASRIGGSIALNYQRWQPICEPARKRGRELGIRVYQFVKDPLIRAFGNEWYEQLCEMAEAYLQWQTNRDELK